MSKRIDAAKSIVDILQEFDADERVAILKGVAGSLVLLDELRTPTAAPPDKED